jgi:hypothetical protein
MLNLRTLFAVLLVATTLTSCQNVSSPSQPSGQPSTLPTSEPTAMPTPIPPQGFTLPTALIDSILEPFDRKGGPGPRLRTQVRFSVQRLSDTNKAEQPVATWEFSSEDLHQRVSPLRLDPGFLKPGDVYGFSVDYVSERTQCEANWGEDYRSVYPSSGAVTVSSTSSISAEETEGLILQTGDISLLDYPVAVHGQVKLPDGKPAVGFQVEIKDSQTTETVMTNSEGYYVSTGKIGGNPVTVSVKALGPEAVFQSYQATVQRGFTPRTQCNEALSKHDIQLLAK